MKQSKNIKELAEKWINQANKKENFMKLKVGDLWEDIRLVLKNVYTEIKELYDKEKKKYKRKNCCYRYALKLLNKIDGYGINEN